MNHWLPGLVDLLAAPVAATLSRSHAARPLPRLRPRDALRAVLVAGQLAELLELATVRAGSSGMGRDPTTVCRCPDATAAQLRALSTPWRLGTPPPSPLARAYRRRDAATSVRESQVRDDLSTGPPAPRSGSHLPTGGSGGRTRARSGRRVPDELGPALPDNCGGEDDRRRDPTSVSTPAANAIGTARER